MSPDTAAPSPPIAKKVIVGVLGFVLAAVIQQVAPGYSPDPIVAQLIDAGIGGAAAFAVREEVKYLAPALVKAREYEDGYPTT